MDNLPYGCFYFIAHYIIPNLIGSLCFKTIMNIVARIILSLADFMIINAVASPLVIGDPNLIIWYSLCVALGFLLRLGMENRKLAAENKKIGLVAKSISLTWAVTIWHSICTVAWCFFMILVWRELGYKKWFEVYLFLNSLFAAFMVTQLEVIGKQSIRDYFRAKIGKLLATEKEEDKV